METKDVKGWNWGAFMFNIVWGFGNKSYMPLICLIPIVNIVWIFVCGAKGNEWAYNKYDGDVDTFLAIQETWNRAGLIMFIISLVVILFWVLLISAGIISLGSALNNSMQ
ncbi:ribonuclease G [Clostridioides mangenotii]|uniref:ribonuclease G n=1 Tax=Metaclostridioides mangenotii TaxID=1540 RepID=UPI002149BFF1|nr:ribonuclease G [Clostridioides mangenotii]MCR1953837.1 ribonuclease G [Clostridioides mangenotii]